MQSISEDIQSVEQKLKQIRDRIYNLQAEGGAPGRAEIISKAPLPTKPYNTGKRKQLATLGAMAGFCGGFAIVLMIGLMDRRLRHFEDAQLGLSNTRMLGVLPELPDDLTDPDQAIMASHCVHQIRTLLQIDRNNDSFVLSVTGPAAGSGKTSLTMALGMSFAASGSRTLLIDCDIVGGGLTSRMLTKDNPRNSPGVLDACNGTAFDNCILKTSSDNLWILPIGSALPSQAGALSPAAMKKLIAKARESYETILIDTGPVLGSLEASLAAAQADATVVIVSRGDQKPIVNKSLDHLRSVGAKLAGVVYNHADDVDIERSTYASVTLSQNRRQDDKMLKRGRLDRPGTVAPSRTIGHRRRVLRQAAQARNRARVSNFSSYDPHDHTGRGQRRYADHLGARRRAAAPTLLGRQWRAGHFTRRPIPDQRQGPNCF